MKHAVYQELSQTFTSLKVQLLKAEPIDCIKLCYQRAFGAAHFCGTPQEALDALQKECSGLCAKEGHLLTPIGGDAVRISLRAALFWQIPLPFLARFFCLCAAHAPQDAAWFSDALDTLEPLCADGVLPFAPQDMRKACRDYRAKGCPPVSHSETFRAAYDPHYRVLSGKPARLLFLALRIAQKLEQAAPGTRVAVALDGFAGAGKTTAAALLSELFDGAPVVAMDDFFLPPNLRKPQRFAQPGGNVHYERFADEVSPHLHSAAPFSYRRFDCSQMDYGDTRNIAAGPLVIVEGSYALHPFMRTSYDVTAFFDIEPAEQQRRILKRNGKAMLARFLSEWIPLEHAYESAFQARRHADFLFPAGSHRPLDSEAEPC